MATPSKPQGSPAPKRPAKAAATLRFEIPETLHRKTLKVLEAVEGSEDATALRDDLAAIVVALMERGLDGYFLEPLQEAKAGFIVQQSAKLGLAGAQQVMGSVIRNIIGRMDGPQLLSVCGSIRRFMR
jgi:hypothetical protein